jgi:hypothetical protein
MERVLILEGCFKCWYKVWGKCFHPDMKKEVCPEIGFLKECPLPTTEAYYEAVKTCKYYDDTDW